MVTISCQSSVVETAAWLSIKAVVCTHAVGVIRANWHVLFIKDVGLDQWSFVGIKWTSLSNSHIFLGLLDEDLG